ncbi:N-acetyltransferase family protein [Bacillus sp. 31A1R]|uniref:N-acetyltransferase family protein n=1 Tax=Robertmurraya mangrovi TaxID=3098077 RepID=A0ABU5J2Z0_9BACI|nr:N-acetyltransferase family protein [Bacillus sp. 31A1R]MDZ5473778.1 N-acetyltransferase family protein [Bacillus sp. 31A1R]
MLNIRNATISDLPAMLEIYNDAILTTTATFDLEVETLETRKIWFTKYGEKYPLIVAELDSKVVGYCCLNPFRDKPAYSKSTELSIYIDNKHRGAGIGSLLMTEIIEEAKKLGYHTLLGGITAGNEGSVRLHEKFRFKNVGCLKEVGYKFGEWQDVYFYQLMLE